MRLSTFLQSCENFQYSKEYFDLYKEAAELDLYDLYQETYTESVYTENTEKKEGFFKKIWNGIISLLQKFWKWLKSFFVKNNDKDFQKKLQDALQGERERIRKQVEEELAVDKKNAKDEKQKEELQNKIHDYEDKLKSLEKKESDLNAKENKLSSEQKAWIKEEVERRVQERLKEITKEQKLTETQKDIVKSIDKVDGISVNEDTWLITILNKSYVIYVYEDDESSKKYFIEINKHKLNPTDKYNPNQVFSMSDFNEYIKTKKMYRLLRLIYSRDSSVIIYLSEIPELDNIGKTLQDLESLLKTRKGEIGEDDIKEINYYSDMKYTSVADALREFSEVVRSTINFHREVYTLLHTSCRNVYEKLKKESEKKESEEE